MGQDVRRCTYIIRAICVQLKARKVPLTLAHTSMMLSATSEYFELFVPVRIQRYRFAEFGLNMPAVPEARPG